MNSALQIADGMTQVNRGSLFEKLALILAEIKHVPKNGRNDFHRYDYIQETDLADAIRPLMAKHGIGIVFGAEEIQDLSDGRMAVKVRITLGDKEGNEITVHVWGVGQDISKDGKVGDKAIYKAMTGAVKYWLYKTFLVSTGDDPEVDAPQTRTRKQAPKANANGEALISDLERKKLLEISRLNEWEDAECKAIVNGLGFDASTDITQEAYPHILEIIKGGPRPVADAVEEIRKAMLTSDPLPETVNA